jgi:hypothetical protein
MLITWLFILLGVAVYGAGAYGTMRLLVTRALEKLARQELTRREKAKQAWRQKVIRAHGALGDPDAVADDYFRDKPLISDWQRRWAWQWNIPAGLFAWLFILPGLGVAWVWTRVLKVQPIIPPTERRRLVQVELEEARRIIAEYDKQWTQERIRRNTENGESL